MILRKMNDWFARYPLSFGLIVVALCVGVLAFTALVQSWRIDDNSVRIEHIHRRDCLVDAFQVAQGTYVRALASRDPAQVASADVDYIETARRLARFTAGDEEVECVVPVLLPEKDGG